MTSRPEYSSGTVMLFGWNIQIMVQQSMHIYIIKKSLTPNIFSDSLTKVSAKSAKNVA